MPFPSINPTNPRTNLRNFREKILRIGDFEKWAFFESAILNFFFRKKKFFFAFFPWKQVKVYWLARMGQNFDQGTNDSTFWPRPNILKGSVCLLHMKRPKCIGESPLCFWPFHNRMQRSVIYSTQKHNLQISTSILNQCTLIKIKQDFNKLFCATIIKA